MSVPVLRNTQSRIVNCCRSTPSTLRIKDNRLVRSVTQKQLFYYMVIMGPLKYVTSKELLSVFYLTPMFLCIVNATCLGISECDYAFFFCQRATEGP